MSPLADRLARHPFLAGLAADTIATLAGCAGETRFAAGEVLFHEGDEADRFYLIEDGKIELSQTIPGRPPMTLLSLHEGDVVGVSWLFPPYRWLYTARARTEVAAIAIDARCLRRKCDADPVLGYALMRLFSGLLVRRLQSARLHMLDVYAPAREQS